MKSYLVFFILYLRWENIISSEIVTCDIIHEAMAIKERLSGTFDKHLWFMQDAKNAKNQLLSCRYRPSLIR